MSLDYSKFNKLKKVVIAGDPDNFEISRRNEFYHNHPTAIAILNDPNPKYIGIEIELENALYKDASVATVKAENRIKYFWNEKPDGSLRNNGTEFVTKLGTTVNTVASLMDNFNNDILISRPDIIANARTGLHVHYNVVGKPLYNVCNALFLYAVIEPAFFQMSGNRFDNIFCVPWYSNYYSLGGVINKIVDHYTISNRAWNWRNYSKYCGLNISTMGTYGTIEFRQHKGTFLAGEIVPWVNAIDNLFVLADSTTLEDNIELFRSNRSNAKYNMLLDRIFNNYEIPDRAQLIDTCREATMATLKGFVDKQCLPTSVNLTAKPVFGRGFAGLEIEEMHIDDVRHRAAGIGLRNLDDNFDDEDDPYDGPEDEAFVPIEPDPVAGGFNVRVEDGRLDNAAAGAQFYYNALQNNAAGNFHMGVAQQQPQQEAIVNDANELLQMLRGRRI